MSMQWADLDSDDSDDDVMSNIPIQHAGLNDGTVQVQSYLNEIEEEFPEQPNDTAEDPKSVQNSADESESEEDDEDDEDEEALREALRKAREEKKLKEEKAKKDARPLTKKEKAALKNQELNDLDNLLNELGVSESNGDVKNIDGGKEKTEVNVEGGQSKSSKKKKKRKKKKDGPTSNKVAEEETVEIVDIATALKSKVKGIKKSNNAATAAAKEAKAKSANKKKDKKKKDKYAHGAPSR